MQKILLFLENTCGVVYILKCYRKLTNVARLNFNKSLHATEVTKSNAPDCRNSWVHSGQVDSNGSCGDLRYTMSMVIFTDGQG